MDKNAMMQAIARDVLVKGSLAWTWLYAEGGEIVSKGAMGWRDPENTLPVTEDTIFQLASVTKQFTAAAVMLLIREGKLGLEDEITKFFPEIPYPGVMVRHLLTHTGGVPDYFEDADWFVKIWENEHRIPGNDEILRFLCESKVKAKFAPGEKWDYSNTGYNLLALLVERLSGVPFEDFLQKKIFEPAGMSATRCRHIRRDGVPFENFAQATVFENGKFVRDVDSEEDADVAAFDGLNGDDYVYSNIFDMLAWDRALRNETVLTKEEQRLMYTPAKLNNGEDAVYDEDDGSGYGFGWSTCRDPELGLVVSHSGGMPGVHTWYERFVDADGLLVILCGREGTDARAHNGLFNGLMDIARGKEPKPIKCLEDLVIQDPDKSKWESFCGKYEHPEDFDLNIDEVWLQDGELYARAIDEDGDPLTFKLYPIGEDTFGRKGGMLEVKFGEGCLIVDGQTCRKL